MNHQIPRELGVNTYYLGLILKLFGYPLEIWAACFIAVLIKLQSQNRLTWFGAIATTLIAILSGILLYQPIMTIFVLSTSWEIPLAIIIALSAENFMRAIVDLSADREWLKEWIFYLVKRKDGSE